MQSLDDEFWEVEARRCTNFVGLDIRQLRRHQNIQLSKEGHVHVAVVNFILVRNVGMTFRDLQC